MFGTKAYKQIDNLEKVVIETCNDMAVRLGQQDNYIAQLEARIAVLENYLAQKLERVA